MDLQQQQRYIKLTKFLGQVLGSRFEIVLHNIAEEGSSIIAIENSYISNRTINSPLTAFASRIIQDKEYLKDDFKCHYKAQTNNNRTINGSTFFIKNGDELVGLLCINYDNTSYKDIAGQILKLGNLDTEIFELSHQNTSTSSYAKSNETITEYLSQDIKDIIAEIIDINLLDSGLVLSIEQKKDTIKLLYQRGIFNIKGAISEVAQILKISEPSIYRYMSEIKKQLKK